MSINNNEYSINRPTIIEFNGMHRCGKWTQIQLLQNFLDTIWVSNIALRWEYYRKWRWDTIGDPYSERWQKNWNNKDLIYEKSNILKKELRNIILEKNSATNKKIILLDRWWMWRCMYDFTQNKHTSMQEALYINSNESPTHLPQSDIYIVLQPTKDELLKRTLYENVDIEYKQDTISNHYEKLYEGFQKVKSQIYTNVLHIANNYDPEEIHHTIKETIYKVWILK